MIKIFYEVGDIEDSIFWAAAEQFDEFTKQTFYLGKMEATEIEKMSGLSVTAKILLSAIAGAIIQRILDSGVEAKTVFADGKFWVGEVDD